MFRLSYLVLALAGAVHAADAPDPNVRTYSDTIAAKTCAQRGYAYMLRLVRDRPEVLCLKTNVQAKDAVEVRQILTHINAQF